MTSHKDQAQYWWGEEDWTLWSWQFLLTVQKMFKCCWLWCWYSLRLRLITPTSTLIILDITKTSSNNCLLCTTCTQVFESMAGHTQTYCNITCTQKISAKHIQLWLGLSTLCQRADSITNNCTYLWSEKRFFVIWMTRVGIRSAPSATSEYESNLYLWRGTNGKEYCSIMFYSTDGHNIISLYNVDLFWQCRKVLRGKVGTWASSVRTSSSSSLHLRGGGL